MRPFKPINGPWASAQMVLKKKLRMITALDTRILEPPEPSKPRVHILNSLRKVCP